ncbi:hypothetical protein SLEP1_g2477 [Rubroshorea leprosula]|uniref:CCHC-type domain-containing protein n=1 Tax=Rubroshorea leprosula TaxID=152421 RepID=A0AAV5HLQ1_9ROSI|nr:hypothetical protein SLEP1_g2477 [Rubroshorea leprosula]
MLYFGRLRLLLLGVTTGQQLIVLAMEEEDLHSMLSRVHISEDQDGILPLHTVWNQEDANVGKLRLVMEVDEGFSRAIRIRIDLEVDKPLQRFKTSQVTPTECKKLRIKYERLSEFCFVCGCLGHLENDCKIANCIKDAGDTQLLAQDKNGGDREQSKSGDHQSTNSLPNNASQIERGNIDGIMTTRGMHEALNQHPDGLPNSNVERLVEVPLVHEFNINKLRGQDKAVKGTKGQWRRTRCRDEPMLHMDKPIHSKRKHGTEFLEEKRACKVMVDNTRMALAPLAKGHDPPVG